MLKRFIRKIFTKTNNQNYEESKDNKQSTIMKQAKEYAALDLAEVKPLDLETIRQLTVEEIQLKIKEYDELIRNNTRMIVEFGYLRAQIRTDNEEETDMYMKITEKLHRLKEIETELKNQEIAYSIQYTALVGFRKKECEHSLREYSAEGTTFWKFSQSRAGIAGEPGVFEKYIPGQITESRDKESLLSFVRAKDLHNCWKYGDQITKLVFDVNDKKFDSIADNPAYETGNGLGEIKTDYLLTEKNYSLSEIETILTIINNSGENKMNAVMTIFMIPGFRERMSEFGFNETVSFIDYVKQRASISDDKLFWISQNICELYNDYKNENSK